MAKAKEKPQTTASKPTVPAQATKTENATQVSGAPVTVALNRAMGIQFTMPDGRTVVIEGNAAKLRGLEKGILPVGAYGLTQIAAADWEYIKKTYGQMDVIKNGLMFAAERKADAVDMADERAELRHGLEPVDVAADTATKEYDNAAV